MHTTTQQAEHDTEIRPGRGTARRLAALLAVLVVSLGLAACGGDDEESKGGGGGGNTGQSDSGGGDALGKNDYLTQVNEAQSQFASESQKLDLANPKGPEDFQKKLEGLIPLVDDLIAKLDDIQPPEQVTAEHDKLVTQLEDYKKVLEDNIDGLGGGDQDKVREAAGAIGQASSKFSTTFDGTINDINAKL
ncbi:MAG: hypothetical protein AABM66_15115 [Actinomycetota bacterium]